MAGLQTILNYSNGLNIDRRKVVGIQYTRNEIPRVSQTPTKNPWKFTLDMPNRFKYYQARDLMEALDTLDRITPEIITFSNLPQLSWIFRYQGAMTSGQLATITVVSWVGTTLTLNVSGITAATTAVIFAPNDLIQIGSSNEYPYPFTSTTQVLRGSGSEVVVTTSRPNILTPIPPATSLTGEGIIVGNNCQFKMFCPNMPTYKLIPGGQAMSGSTVINNALLEFSDAFELYEFVGTA
jgi:hypothetical protein